MADEHGDAAASDIASSLARLRMFLAPHKPSAGLSHDTNDPHAGGSAPVSVPAANEQNVSDAASHIDSPSAGGLVEQCADDISALVEEMTAAADEEDRIKDTSGVGGAQESGDVAGELDMVSAADAAKQTTAPPLGAVATVSPVNTSSREFARVKYLLQCSLPGFLVHDDIVMWDMKNPALVEQYEQHTSGLLELDSWVDVDNLSHAMGDAHSNGLGEVTVGPSVMKFTTGNIAIDAAVAKKGRQQLVLCKIAVGRSFIVANEKEARITRLPAEYHSYYIHSDSLAADVPDSTQEHSFVGRGYCHEYILNDALQILPQYLVRFSYSALDLKKPNQCALCEKHAAVLACKSCEAELCTKCDLDVHSANKLVSRHKRLPLKARGAIANHQRARRRSSTPSSAGAEHDQASPADSSESEVNAIVSKQLEDGMVDFQGVCRVHEGKKVEFYCPLCSVPVCVNCKMVGDHSIGEKGAHRLLGIADAYESSLRESFKPDPLVESRKSVLDNKLSLINQWKLEIARNREQVEAALHLQYQQALCRLNAEVHKKVGVLDGEALEFQRQQQHIEWLEDCLDEQRSACSVVDFLTTWNQHKTVRAEQRDFPPVSHISVGEHVKADIQLVGRLEIVTGDHYEPRKSYRGLETEPSDREVSIGSSVAGGASDANCASVRRTSDSEMRRKLITMKTLVNEPRNASPAPSVLMLSSSTSTLSAKGLKMMEEIRQDLLAKGTIGRAPPAPSTISSPMRSALNWSNPTATLRGISVHPVRKKSAGGMGTGSDRGPRHSCTDAWTALLRQELGIVDASGTRSDKLSSPEQ